MTRALAPPAWQTLAACQGYPPAMFFPERGDSANPAREVCAGCQVRDECLAHAFAVPERCGVWGGLSERQRRKVRTRRLHATPAPVDRRAS